MSEENSGAAREPLLRKEEATAGAIEATDTDTIPATVDDAIDTGTGDGSQGEETAGVPSATLLGCCTLAVVLIGVGLVLFVSFLPLWIYLGLLFLSPGWPGLLLATVLNLLHLRALWISATYLYILRTLVVPIRRLLLPLVPLVARIESIREQETTQYYTPTSTDSTPNFRKSVRRHYKRMQNIYQRHGIRHCSVRAETGLVLRHVIPIVWAHQQRTTDQATPLEDFIKRALVITVVPDGVLDLYYDSEDQLVGVQFSILQGQVWHWFMYFCTSPRAGIWWHGALLAIQRGHATGAEWVNAQTHQADSKLHAGYTAAAHTQHAVLSQIYPFAWTRHIPDEALEVRLWDSS